eukprot:6209001-Pleurochrysis_carterae.AAC.1
MSSGAGKAVRHTQSGFVVIVEEVNASVLTCELHVLNECSYFSANCQHASILLIVLRCANEGWRAEASCLHDSPTGRYWPLAYLLLSVFFFQLCVRMLLPCISYNPRMRAGYPCGYDVVCMLKLSCAIPNAANPILRASI